MDRLPPRTGRDAGTAGVTASNIAHTGRSTGNHQMRHDHKHAISTPLGWNDVRSPAG